MPFSLLRSPISETPITQFREGALPQATVAVLWRGHVIGSDTLVLKDQKIGLTEARYRADASLHSQPALNNHIEEIQADMRNGLLRRLSSLLVGGVVLACLVL